MYLEPQKGSCACAQTLLASNASSCRTPIRLHTCHGSQLHLPFHQPVLDIFSKYYFAGFFPSLFVKSTVITIRMHQIIEPMELTAGEMNICVPPETPTGCSSAGSQPLSMNHRVRCPHPTEPGTHWAKLWGGHCWAHSPRQRREPGHGRMKGNRSARAGKVAKAVLWLKNERRTLWRGDRVY